MKTARWIVEQLEPRIAPAGITLVNGANLLSAGDQGNLSEADPASDATTLVKCSAGKALVFWDATAREIKGISVADGVNLEVLGNITGDVVTNLESTGFLSDSDNNPDNGLDGGKLLPSSIAGIKTSAYFDSTGKAQNGDAGRIVAGGSISNVILNGDLKGAYAGDGIFDAVASAASPTPAQGGPATQFQFVLGKNFDTSGKSDISTMTLKMSAATFGKTASINNVSFAGGTNVQVFSGDGQPGSAGAAGGSVSKVSFVGAGVDTSVTTGFFAGVSYTVFAGEGSDTTDLVAGTGGSINGVTEMGSAGTAHILGGAGGDASGKGNGGIGGSITSLDLHGSPSNYQIHSGDGGGGAAGGAGGAVSNVAISSNASLSLAAPFTDDKFSEAKDFVVIDRGSGDMVLLHGATQVGAIVPSLGRSPVDALVSDVNSDSYNDVVVIYADKTLGFYVNNGDDTFAGSSSDLGYVPFKILAGNFLGDGSNPEVTILSTDASKTVLRLYEYNGSGTVSADSFEINKDYSLVYNKGNLADAVGGTTSLSSYSRVDPADPKKVMDYEWQMSLMSDKNKILFGQPFLSADLTLAFSDGTLQGVFSLASPIPAPEGKDQYGFETTVKTPCLSVTAPRAFVDGGISSVDYSFGDNAMTYDGSVVENPPDSFQAMAVVNRAGTAVQIVSIALGEITVPIDPAPTTTPTGSAPETTKTITTNNFVFSGGSSVALKPGCGSVLQASWIANAASLKDIVQIDQPYPSLMVLASDSTSSTAMFYDGSGGAIVGASGAPIHSGLNGLYNSFSNNFTSNLYSTSSDVEVFIANSFLFTTGNPSNIALWNAYIPLPACGNPNPMNPTPENIGFASKHVWLSTGDGGSGVAGNGGTGGMATRVHAEANFADIWTGDGGTSTAGAGGNGGSLSNAGSFIINSRLIKPSFNITDNLVVTAGDGADVSGSSAKSQGGSGGSITGVYFQSSGHAVAGLTLLGSVELAAGNGGSSESLAAGNGGAINSTTLANALDATLVAGMGGSGAVGSKASGGNGGIISGVTANYGIFPAHKLASTAFSLQLNPDSNPGDAIRPGFGGDSAFAKAGNGGGVSGVAFKNAYSTIRPAFGLIAGDGGNSLGVEKTANGGLGGVVSNLNIQKVAISDVFSGNGGNAIGGSGGAAGGILNLTYVGGLMNLTAGIGGSSLGLLSTGTGGAGGAISGLNADVSASGYMTVEAGRGGSGVGAGGGAGGTVTNSSFKLNPDSRTKGVDETLGVTVKSGIGGNGSRGGAGGLISGVSCEGVYDNPGNDGFVTVIDSIAMRFLAGDGGEGTAGDGGAGGSINFGKTLLGISQIDADSTEAGFLPGDEAVRVVAGDGGNGAAKGGAGGSVNALKVANVKANNLGEPIPLNILGSAFVRSGDGGDGGSGDGGAGGAVASARLSVERQENDLTGNIRILTGDGGNSVAAKGGAGGVLQNSTFAAINGNNHDGYAALLQTGSGGTGAKSGGAGGNIASITLAVTSVGIDGTDADIYSAVILAGSGGNGTGLSKATGGVGGSISGITQPAGVYSVINLIQAGSGGNSSADIAGAIGGSVTNVKSQGYIGALTAAGSPQGLYNKAPVSAFIDPLVPDKHQGVFSGLGGTGSARGLNGSVTGVSAPAIAAIAAANLSGTFDRAAVVSKIAALYHPGFDMDNSGTYSPGDGYILAAKFDPAKDLVSLDQKIVTTANLVAKTIPFVNPVP